jgi:hypothetical protein
LVIDISCFRVNKPWNIDHQSGMFRKAHNKRAGLSLKALPLYRIGLLDYLTYFRARNTMGRVLQKQIEFKVKVNNK